MGDIVLYVFPTFIVLAVALALIQNRRDRAANARRQAAYDAATEASAIALRESLDNQRRMLALFEEMNATLRRIEERPRP